MGRDARRLWWIGKPTRKWERDHATPQPDDASPAMKEAEDIDKEEAALRDEQKGRMPEVARDWSSPTRTACSVLDTFQGTPELVELVPSELSMNQKKQAWPQHPEPPCRTKGEHRIGRRPCEGASARE